VKAGWKNDPIWRVYHEQRKLMREVRRMQRQQIDQQMEALSADAELIMVKIQEDANKTPGTRH
jgi:hypothetical protein